MSENATAAPIPGATSSTRSGPEYTIREATKEDRGFVADSWVSSHRASGRQTKVANKGTFFRHVHRAVDRILDAPGVEIRVAAPRDDSFTIYGFAVVAPASRTVFMVYVKAGFRRTGIARALLRDIGGPGVRFTHWTRDMGQWIWDKFDALRIGGEKQTLTYDPYWEEEP